MWDSSKFVLFASVLVFELGIIGKLRNAANVIHYTTNIRNSLYKFLLFFFFYRSWPAESLICLLNTNRRSASIYSDLLHVCGVHFFFSSLKYRRYMILYFAWNFQTPYQVTIDCKLRDPWIWGVHIVSLVYIYTRSEALSDLQFKYLISELTTHISTRRYYLRPNISCMPYMYTHNNILIANASSLSDIVNLSRPFLTS